MTLERKALAEKIIVVGIDGMDPRLTNKYLKEGKMPNTKKILERGSAREDLVLLGAQPTVTPPMWTTLATGTYPVTHGITGFARQHPGVLDMRVYNLDSTKCKAEPLWNVFAEAGKKTLVWAWPGSSWPPTSDNPNLHVVDGTQPVGPNAGNCAVEMDVILMADETVDELKYRKKAASDANVACVITDLEVEEDRATGIFERVNAAETRQIILNYEDGECGVSSTPFDIWLSPLKEAHGWADAPQGAKEFTMMFSGGLVRRPGLALVNEAGVYDRVALYKSKKDAEPYVVLEKDVFTPNVFDELLKKDQKVLAYRSMRLLDIAEDGSSLKIWASFAFECDNDTLWHPKHLYKSVTENVGYPQPMAILGGGNKQLITDCMAACWDHMLDWNAEALKYLIKAEGYEMVFSQVHNVDAQGHMIIQFMKDKGRSKLSEAEYAQLVEDMYIQTDNYIGKFLPLLDEGWTVLVVSDHAQVCPENEPPMMGDASGVSVRVMEELGLTNLKHDENGKELREIDWERTKAVCNRGNHIYVNLKGRDEHGIVEPEDKYEVEEEIMTKLYGYTDKKTGKRICALALRNRDAVLLGLGGPESGDILYWNAEGYNYDHCDSLSTTYGFGDTSVSPIFFGAGPGLKVGHKTERIIRQVDFAPTMAVLGGVRMPAHCEGAPAYQILTEEY